MSHLRGLKTLTKEGKRVTGQGKEKLRRGGRAEGKEGGEEEKVARVQEGGAAGPRGHPCSGLQRTFPGVGVEAGFRCGHHWSLIPGRLPALETMGCPN